MKIYNENKTKELKHYDLTKGCLHDDYLIVHHDEVIGQSEEGHYETIKTYPNGGKDVEWVIDKERIVGKPAWDEKIPIKVYIEYDEKHLKIESLKKRIKELKKELSDTDYQTLKYIDGLYTEEEYNLIKDHRNFLREQINILTEELEVE